MKRYLKIFCVILLMTSCTARFSYAVSPQAHEEVRAYLQARKDWKGVVTESKPTVQDLAHLGDEALPALAEFLRDSKLGYEATWSMLELNPTDAAPLIFSAMPKSEGNGQRNAFKFYIRQIRDGKPFAYSREMHDAAVRCLEAHDDITVEIQTLLAVGLTGDKKDFPILEKYYNNEISVELWRLRVCFAAQAALARLGHKKYLKNITRELQAPLPTILTRDWASRLCESMSEAAFSGNKRFVPLLCKHLDTPTPKADGDWLPPHPAWEAANALNVLVGGKSPDEHASLKYWREWRDKPNRKQSQQCTQD